jgi:primosomal protein N'
MKAKIARCPFCGYLLSLYRHTGEVTRREVDHEAVVAIVKCPCCVRLSTTTFVVGEWRDGNPVKGWPEQLRME